MAKKDMTGESPSERAGQNSRSKPGSVTVVGTPDPKRENTRDPITVRNTETAPNPGQSYPTE